MFLKHAKKRVVYLKKEESVKQPIYNNNYSIDLC